MKKGTTSSFWRAKEMAHRMAFENGSITPAPVDAGDDVPFKGKVVRRRRYGVTLSERCCLDEGFKALV